MSKERENRAARAEQMRKEREKAAKRQRNAITVGIVAVVIVLIGLAAYGIRAASPSYETELVAPNGTTDDYGIIYDAEAAGAALPDDAEEPVEVELYEDFQCPACEAFEAVSGQFLKQLVAAGEITIVYRPFSFLDEAGASPNQYSKRATNAALAVLDAAGVAKYAEFHDYLYANQPQERVNGPSDADLIAAAASIGVTGIDEAIENRRFFPWIKEAKAAGSDRGVTGTPTVYIAGEISDARTPDQLMAAIEAAKQG